MPAWEREVGIGWASAQVVDESRIRHPSGAEIEATHIPGPDGDIFAVFHRPPASIRGIVVVCSPPYAEAVRNHRRELLLGWLLTDRHLAAVRFHPRGSGHSGGDTEGVTLDSIEDDAQRVAQVAADRLDSPLVGFVGTRLGAVIAHRVASTWPGSAVVWWHPVLDGEGFMRELFRARIIGELKRGKNIDQRALRDQLMSEEGLDVLGSAVSRDFAESLTARPLDDVPDGPRRGLLVQMSRHSELRRRYKDFVANLERRKWSVDTLVIPDEEAWWFGARPGALDHELRSVAMSVVPATVEFFHTRIGVWT